MPLALPDVTLCAVTAINHELTARAMNICLEHASFADAVLITDRPVEVNCRVEIVPHFSGAEFAPFICRNLTKYTPSGYNLMVQYDGYIADPSAWRDEFLDYDFIGAKWPWHPPGRRVGNSGFCLRTKKLLDLMAEMPLPPTGTFVDDVFVCHTMRAQMEKRGVKFAPEEIADLFAYERHVPAGPVFGFHGMFNFWRHAPDADMIPMPPLLHDYYVTCRAYAEVLFHYHAVSKKPVFHAWYRRLRAHVGEAQVKEHLLQYLKDAAFIDELIRNGEQGA